MDGSHEKLCIALFIIRLEARLQPNIGNTHTTRFDGVHAFGYIFTESEPIWMKSGTL